MHPIKSDLENKKEIKPMKIICLVFLVFIGAGAMDPLPAAGETFYIAPSGSDAWSGTLAEADGNDGPLATLDRARQLVRECIAKGLTSPVTVKLRDGEYDLDSTVVFSPEDSGTDSCPITYQAYGDEKPVFTGAKRLVDWKPCSSEPAGLPEAAKGKLWVCDIPSELKGKWQITTLYDGLTVLPRAQSEELTVPKTKVKYDLNNQPKSLMGKILPDDEPLVFTRTFNYQGDDLREWPDISDVEIFIKARHSWVINLLPLVKVDDATKTATFTLDPTYQIKEGNFYFVQNAFDYLDEPGEWCFSSREGRIYLWPKRPLTECDIRAPFLQEFIRVEGVEDGTPARFVNFSGLTFHHGLRDTWLEDDIGLQHDWDMYDKGNAIMRFRHAEDCSVDESVFTASSGSGVRLDLHCQRINVSSSLFSHLGGTGILLSGYGAGTKDENHHNTITNNLIHHVGEIYWHSPAIFIAQSGHNLISHNTIHDLGYNGMTVSGIRPHELMFHKPLANRREWVGSLRLEECQPYIDLLIEKNKDTKDWRASEVEDFMPLLHSGENRIEYNDISRVMLRLEDGNAIYLSCMGENNRVVGNYVHEFLSHRSSPIRLDDNPSFTYLSDNVCYGSKYGIAFKGPAEARNNIFIDVEDTHIGLRPRFRIDKRSVYESNLHYRSRTDHKGNAFPPADFWNKLKGEEDTYFNCLFFCDPAPSGVKPGDVLIPSSNPDKAQVGLQFGDPMLDTEALKNRIFRFKPGSPSEKLGIKPVDLSKVGSTVQDLLSPDQ